MSNYKHALIRCCFQYWNDMFTKCFECSFKLGHVVIEISFNPFVLKLLAKSLLIYYFIYMRFSQQFSILSIVFISRYTNSFLSWRKCMFLLDLCNPNFNFSLEKESQMMLTSGWGTMHWYFNCPQILETQRTAVSKDCRRPHLHLLFLRFPC